MNHALRQVEVFAVQIPLEVISRMMGVGDADAERFHGWTQRFAQSTSTGPLAKLRGFGSLPVRLS